MSEPDPLAPAKSTPNPATPDAEIGWGRAVASSLAVLVVGFGGAVVGANAIVTDALALTRTAREWLASALFFAVILVLAFLLRRLQDRGLV